MQTNKWLWRDKQERRIEKDLELTSFNRKENIACTNERMESNLQQKKSHFAKVTHEDNSRTLFITLVENVLGDPFRVFVRPVKHAPVAVAHDARVRDPDRCISPGRYRLDQFDLEPLSVLVVLNVLVELDGFVARRADRDVVYVKTLEMNNNEEGHRLHIIVTAERSDERTFNLKNNLLVMDKSRLNKAFSTFTHRIKRATPKKRGVLFAILLLNILPIQIKSGSNFLCFFQRPAKHVSQA